MPAPHCRRCGYDLTGVRVDAECPECGEPVISLLARPTPHGPATRTAYASVILGSLALVAIFAFGLPGFLLGLLAVLLSRRVRVEHEHVGTWTRSLKAAGLGELLGLIAMIIGALVFCAITLPPILNRYLE